MKHYTVEGVLFDLDGTLICREEGFSLRNRSHPSTAELIRDMVSKFGLPPNYNGISRIAEFWNLVSFSINSGMIRKDVSDGLMKYLNGVFEKEDRRSHENCRLLPHAKETLKEIKESGRKIGIVTNTSRKDLSEISEKFGLKPYIDVNISRDDSGYIKPHPEPVLRAIGQLNIKRFKYVGDSDHDARSCKDAGGHYNFILYNTRKYPESAILHDIRPSAVIDSLEPLPNLIEQDFVMLKY